MKLIERAAIVVALTLGAAAFAGATSPDEIFVEQDLISEPSTNALPSTKVPTPPAPIVPAEWTSETGDGDLIDPATGIAGDYASLSDAVAAQAMPDAIDDETECLAIGVYFESKGEPLSGQLAVAEVILNRAESGRFPRSVCSVLTQPRQFSFVRGGRLPQVRTSSKAWRTAVAVAQVAQGDHWQSQVPGALFFHARYVSPGWRLAKVGSVGNHIFYR